MNFNSSLLKLSGLALVVVAGSLAAVACSSSSSGNSPMTTIDSGNPSGSSSGVASGSSSGTISSSSSSSGGGEGGGSSSGAEAGPPCVADGGPDAQCNSCATIGGSGSLGSYNTCSQYLVNCTPFNNTARGVPIAADGGLPTP